MKYQISFFQIIIRSECKIRIGFIQKIRAERYALPLFYNGCYYYLACSNCNVLVGSSHTSVGPKYWIGPGYT